MDMTTLVRARVPTKRFKNVSKILNRLGMKPSDAFNLLLAQIELRKGLPFEVTIEPSQLLSAESQAGVWTETLGEY